MRVVYRLNEAIPEIGARRNDIVLVEPGVDPPVLIIREFGRDVIEVIAHRSPSLTLTSFRGRPPRSVAELRRWFADHAKRMRRLKLLD